MTATQYFGVALLLSPLAAITGWMIYDAGLRVALQVWAFTAVVIIVVVAGSILVTTR